jgi:hypothetical protein
MEQTIIETGVRFETGILRNAFFRNIKKLLTNQKTMELTNPIQEAERYIQNARRLLSEKAGKDGEYYTDRKYVKMAGHTAWCGVLVALDAALKIREGMKKGQRPDIKDYVEAVGKIDLKMPRILMTSYDVLHKALGYDGVLSYDVVQAGLKEAQNIIEWAGKHYTECPPLTTPKGALEGA